MSKWSYWLVSAHDLTTVMKAASKRYVAGTAIILGSLLSRGVS